MKRRHGFCWKCNDNPPAPGRTACDGCLESEREHSRTNHARERRAAKIRLIHPTITVRDVVPVSLDDLIALTYTTDPPEPLEWAGGAYIRYEAAADDDDPSLIHVSVYYAKGEYARKVVDADRMPARVIDNSRGGLVSDIAAWLRTHPTWQD